MFTLHAGGLVLARNGSRFRMPRVAGLAFEPEALARDRDDLRMVQELVQDRRGGRHITDQFAPILHGQVGRVTMR